MSTITIDGVDYVTSVRAAEMFGVKKSTVHLRVKAGTLGAVRKVGTTLLIPVQAIESWKKGSLRDLPDDVHVARTREKNRRNAKAQGRARSEVAKRYYDEYLELFHKYRDEIMNASPLPGDEPAS